MHRAAITDFWALDAECLSLAVNAFTTGALVVDPLVERAVTIEGDTHETSQLPIEIFDTAFSFGKLSMVTGLISLFREEQRTTKALCTIAIGVIELIGGMHA